MARAAAVEQLADRLSLLADRVDALGDRMTLIETQESRRPRAPPPSLLFAASPLGQTASSRRGSRTSVKLSRKSSARNTQTTARRSRAASRSRKSSATPAAAVSRTSRKTPPSSSAAAAAARSAVRSAVKSAVRSAAKMSAAKTSAAKNVAASRGSAASAPPPRTEDLDHLLADITPAAPSPDDVPYVEGKLTGSVAEAESVIARGNQRRMQKQKLQQKRAPAPRVRMPFDMELQVRTGMLQKPENYLTPTPVDELSPQRKKEVQNALQANFMNTFSDGRDNNQTALANGGGGGN